MTKKRLDSPLRNLRKARALTQADLARLVRVSQQTIAKAERGRLRLRPDVEARIATVLGVSRGELFQDSAAVAV